MFSYCRNNPVRRVDVTGTADVDCLDETDDVGLDHEEAGKPSGGDNYFDAQQAILDGSFSRSRSNTVPQKAWDVLNHLKDHNWHPPQNHKGGKKYENDGRDNSEILPDYGAPYYEYDVNPRIKGVDRGNERIVTNKAGMTWYTPSHYKYFIRME